MISLTKLLMNIFCNFSLCLLFCYLYFLSGFYIDRMRRLGNTNQDVKDLIKFWNRGMRKNWFPSKQNNKRLPKGMAWKSLLVDFDYYSGYSLNRSEFSSLIDTTLAEWKMNFASKNYILYKVSQSLADEVKTLMLFSSKLSY